MILVALNGICAMGIIWPTSNWAFVPSPAKPWVWIRGTAPGTKMERCRCRPQASERLRIMGVRDPGYLMSYLRGLGAVRAANLPDGSDKERAQWGLCGADDVTFSVASPM